MESYCCSHRGEEAPDHHVAWIGCSTTSTMHPSHLSRVSRPLFRTRTSSRSFKRDRLSRRSDWGYWIDCLRSPLSECSGVFCDVVTHGLLQEPKSFIRVIVGLLTFTPDRLGYDTTMSLMSQKRVYATLDEVDSDPRPSYTVVWNETKNEHYWLLDMPKPKQGSSYGVMDNRETETFVLYKAISVHRGGIIRGRATRIWKAWLLDELTKEPAERRVRIEAPMASS